MILPVDLPAWLKATGVAAIAGLILGLGLGALSGSYLSEKATVELGEPWTRREVSVDTLLEVVDSSEHWRRGAAPVVEEPIPEEDIEVPDERHVMVRTRDARQAFLRLMTWQQDCEAGWTCKACDQSVDDGYGICPFCGQHRNS